MTIKEAASKFAISQDTLRYYERVGAIPPVGRTAGGIRDYEEEDLKWIQTAMCLRNAGVSIESIVEYVKLFQQGNGTFEARRALLSKEREGLIAQIEHLKGTVALLDYKISRYEIAVKTGELSWKVEE